MEKLTDIEIVTPSPGSYPELIYLWERSVRATHGFLAEEDIHYFKPLILHQYFHHVELACAMANGRPVGFVGVAERKIEMLFVDPSAMGKGLGKTLLLYGINTMGANSLDVNEQNVKAVGFYLHHGFKVVSRSPVDSMGKPFPILHLEMIAS